MENDVQHWARAEVQAIEAALKQQEARCTILEQTLELMVAREQKHANDVQMLVLAAQKLANGALP